MEYGGLLAFTMAAFFLNLSPGPSLLYVSARGVQQGKTAGALSAIGLASGSAIHAIFAGIGITTIIAQNELISMIVALAGGGYILYLGLDGLEFQRRVEQGNTSVKIAGKSYKNIFFQSMMVEFLNPKTILFYLAILPGILAMNDYSLLEAILISLIVPATALPIDLVAGMTGGHLSKSVSRSPKISIVLNNFSSLALSSIGVFLVLTSGIFQFMGIVQ